MNRSKTRLWVLLSVMTALFMILCVQRAAILYARTTGAPSKERVVKQQVAWIIEGVATSTQTNLERARMSERAVAEAVAQLSTYTTVFLNHEHEMPVGHIVDVVGEKDRVRVKIEISKTQPILWKLLRDGTISGLSIGIYPLEKTHEWCDFFNDQIMIIERGYIFEVSIVYIPADLNARITACYVEPR